MSQVYIAVILAAIAWMPGGYCSGFERAMQGLAGRRFTDTVKFDLAENVQYSFVLVRAGMHYPDNTKEITFPKDKFKEDKYYAGRVASDGLALMRKVARSLKMRYSLRTLHSNLITISAANRGFTKLCAQEIVNEINKNRKDSFAQTEVLTADYDPLDLFYDSTKCRAYHKLVEDVTKRSLPYDAEFNQLTNSIGGRSGVSEEWDIKTTKQVYWLQQILDYQKAMLRDPQPCLSSSGQYQTIDRITKDYLKQVITGDKKMLSFLLERMHIEIINEFRKGQKMHIHVTDDRTFAAFKHQLINEPLEVPKFGETLIIEVYKKKGSSQLNDYNVVLFSPDVASYKSDARNLQSPPSITTDFTTFTQYLKAGAQGTIPPVDWIAKCNPKEPAKTPYTAPKYAHSDLNWARSSPLAYPQPSLGQPSAYQRTSPSVLVPPAGYSVVHHQTTVVQPAPHTEVTRYYGSSSPIPTGHHGLSPVGFGPNY